MNAQDLKNSILQLAMQGNLVEQRADEGTAKELLVKIEAKKDQLIKDGKIKKEKEQLKISEDEIPFDIPESWEWIRMLKIAEMYTGNSIPKSMKDNKYSKIKNGYDYIGTKDIGFDYTINYDNGIKIPCEEYKFKNSFKNSLLMCIEGGSAGRKIGILDRTVCFGNKLCSFNLLSGEPKFLYYYLQSPQFLQAFRGEMTGIIGGVSITKLKSIVMPLPPLEEQKRIVAKIEQLMFYMDKYCVAYSEVKELNKKFPEDIKKSFLQYAIQGKLVEQCGEDGTAEDLYQQIRTEKKRLTKEGKIKKTAELPEITRDEIPFDIPESWKWIRLADIFEVNPRNNVNNELSVSFIPMALIKDGYVSNFAYEIRSWGDVKKGYTHFQDDDIVMAKITPCFQNLKSALMKDLVNGTGAGSTELHVLRSHSDICREYFLWFIKSPIFVSTCLKNMTGTAGQKRVPTDVLKSCVVPLPPLAEQKRIVEKIEKLSSCIKSLL